MYVESVLRGSPGGRGGPAAFAARAKTCPGSRLKGNPGRPWQGHTALGMPCLLECYCPAERTGKTLGSSETGTVCMQRLSYQYLFAFLIKGNDENKCHIPLEIAFELSSSVSKPFDQQMPAMRMQQLFKRDLNDVIELETLCMLCCAVPCCAVCAVS